MSGDVGSLGAADRRDALVGLSRLTVLFAAFVMLGLPEGAIGTVWPSMRATYGRPESALAVLLITYVLGYVVAAPQTDRLSTKLGFDGTIRVGMIFTAAGLALHVLSPIWLLAGAASFILGCGAGLVDSAINADVALHHGTRTMNLLHASFGIGATLGPLLMTAVLAIDAPWRSIFVVLALTEVALILLLGRAGRATSATEAPQVDSEASRLARRPGMTLAATLAFFAFYVAIEVSVGQWTFSVLTESDGIAPTAAGLAMAAYWGGLTVGRLFWAGVGDRIGPRQLLRWSFAVLAVGVVWFVTAAPGYLIALAIIGLAFSGMFPAMVLLSAIWFEPDRVARAVGWQLAASGIGSIAAAIALGRITATAGLDALPIAYVVLAVALAATYVATEWAAISRHRQ